MPRGPDPLIGTVAVGCRLEQLLGRGGMGSVYAARTAHGKPVVIKVLAEELTEQPALRARFGREGLALKKLRAHPNVVRVHEVVDDPFPAIAMELVDGPALDRVQQERGRLEPREVARIGRDVALGLGVIHAAGLVHRDIKPANVLLTSDGRAKIVDLGLAKDVFMSGLTAPGQLLGTVSYMAPEQWNNGVQDARCDVFALGATLYHLAVGRPPFQAPEVADVADQAMAADYPMPTELVPGFPADLELILVQMLMPEPERRYQSAEACAEDLEGFLGGAPASVPALVSSDGARFPLLTGRKFSIGRRDGSDVHLDHPSVSKKHARLARKEKGYVLTNLRGSSGSWVGGQAVKGPTPLSDGDAVRLGELELTFEDPQSRPRTPPYLRDVRRETHPAPAVEALALRRDPRAVLHLLGQLSHDPIGERADALALEPLLGQSLSALIQRRRQLEEQRRTWLSTYLPEVTGEASKPTDVAWLEWWDLVRTSYPGQVVEARALPGAVLRVQEPGLPPRQHPLGEVGVTLLGRDDKCQVRLADPKVARLHAAVLRLHTRWLLRDEASANGTLMGGVRVNLTWLNPGDAFALPPAQAQLVVQDPVPARSAQGHLVVDPLSFQVLRDLRHPSVCAGLVGLLLATQGAPWHQQVAQALFQGAEVQTFTAQLRELHAQRAQHARELLVGLLGADAGPDPAAWQGLLAQRAAQLGPQVVPRGWVS